MTPCWENTVLFRSSQQLPSSQSPTLERAFLGWYSALQGTAVPGHRQEQPTQISIVRLLENTKFFTDLKIVEGGSAPCLITPCIIDNAILWLVLYRLDGSKASIPFKIQPRECKDSFYPTCRQHILWKVFEVRLKTNPPCLQHQITVTFLTTPVQKLKKTTSISFRQTCKFHTHYGI